MEEQKKPKSVAEQFLGHYRLHGDATSSAYSDYNRAERELWEGFYQDAISMKLWGEAGETSRQLTPEETAFAAEHADRSMEHWRQRFAEGWGEKKDK
jgi:hypothetical protein